MIRILHVVGGLSRGGTESSIMNLYRYIDKSCLQFDFISHHPELNEYEDEIRSNGGEIYHIPEYTGLNFARYVNAWNRFFQEHKEHTILHSHAWSTAAIYLPIARRNGIFSISHSHSVSAGEGLPALGRYILKPFIKGKADYYMACSEEAGKWLFGNSIVKGESFHILPNAVDLELLRYETSRRKQLREKYNVSEKTIIGHIGSFNSNKNQRFLLDVFKKIHTIRPDTLLWLIGEGKLHDQIESLTHVMGLEDSVRFLGIRHDIPDLLQAIDLFLFPSKHESFGSAALEAEAAGIPTICSTNVPKNEVLSGNIIYLPIDNSIQWANQAIELMNYSSHKDVYTMLKGSRLDIEVTARWLQDFYMETAEKGNAR